MPISEDFYQSLLMVNNLLLRETTRAGLFKGITTIIQPLIHCDRCSLSLYDPQTDGLSWFAQAEGVNITAMDDSSTPMRGPLARQAISAKATHVVYDLDSIDDDAVRHMTGAGLTSSVALPLLNHGEAIGAIVFSYARRLTEQDQGLVVLLEKIAGQVALAVSNIVAHDKLSEMNKQLMHQVGSLLYLENELYAEKNFFWQCKSMRHVIEQSRMVARSNVPVLILGETGVGKEFLARYIHNHSLRKRNNFVKLSCPSLSSSLFESEMFGHARGAFTGADKNRMGRLEVAHKGSMFLDEIGDLDKFLQAKLLQVLQDACFERVGETRPIQVDVRFISSTNADLKVMMDEKQFRRDLFYRLGGVIIHVPPLRERAEEIPQLIKHLAGVHSVSMECAPFAVSPQAKARLSAYHWPGNVRELSNMVKRLLILYPGQEVQGDMLDPVLENTAEASASPPLPCTPEAGEKAPVAAAPSLPSAQENTPLKLDEAERQLIRKVLTMANGVVSGPKGASTLLGIPRSTLLYKIKKHRLNVADYSCEKNK